MAYTQVSVLVVLSLGGSMTKGAAISESDLRMIAMILSGGWLTAMITLLVSSERGSRHTFYQPTRAWEYSKALFDTGIDEYRMSIFDDHPSYYSWYAGELKEWLIEVWDDLHQKKPVWFDDETTRRIPLALVPNCDDEEFKAELRMLQRDHDVDVVRRKSSIEIITAAALQI